MKKDTEEYNKYMKEYMLNRYHESRAKLIEEFGGACIKCGASEDLQFHHQDPEEKEFTLGRGWSTTPEAMQEEAAKCELLCQDCHKEVHRAPCGTRSRYRAGCRCDECRGANSTYMREYKRRKTTGV